MGCNCKKQNQVLNNLNSTDHLKIAFDTYDNYIKDKPMEYEYDEADNKIFISTFFSLYPNVKVQVTPIHALETIKNINKQYGR
jgi:hypothetical protein